MDLIALQNTVLTSPATGDRVMMIVGIGAAVCAVLVIIVLLMGKRRK